MPGPVRFALVLAALLAPAKGAPPVQGAADERSRVEADVRQLREARERAYAALSAAYAETEAWFLRLREDGGASFRPALEGAARAGLAALAVEEREGRVDPAAAARAVSFLRQRLAPALREAGVPATVATLLAGRLAESLRGEGAVPPADAVGSALAALIDFDRPFHESWNRGIFREASAARDFAAAEKALAEGMLRLEKLRRPERFHPAYASTPEGMVLIPGGTYTVGIDSGWDLDTDRTKKSFEAQIRSFFLDRSEVTHRRYRRFVASLPAAEAEARIPSSWVRSANAPPAPPPGKEDHPVTGVSLEDALAFAAWAGCRLPTEDEWSLAARGPAAFTYPWGNAWDPARTNHGGSGRGDTAPAGAYPGDRSPFGCLDMAGNVSEWTATYPDGKPVQRLRENANVVLRGGSFRRPGSKESASWRWAYPAMTTREADIGFRCAQDAPER